ncbi:mitochondrial ribonuclease P catalytic subunit-like [Antedon mediterranea]|uniref:mitochondrial ribonuclease P catalytic subunit-like n=1 Tax=Antedon mediterranea TaxID=105859 RepID=UPI003AF51033
MTHHLKSIVTHLYVGRRYVYHNRCVSNFIRANQEEHIFLTENKINRNVYASVGNLQSNKIKQYSTLSTVHDSLFGCNTYNILNSRNCSNNAIEKPVKRSKVLNDAIDKPDTYLSEDEWMKIKLVWDEDNRLNLKSGRMVFVEKAMSLTCRNKSWQLANSLFHFANSIGFNPTKSFMNSYLYICKAAEKRDEVLSICDWFSNNSTVLDAAILKNIVNGLCLTDRWKESLTFLETAKGTINVSSGAVNSVVCCACSHKEYDLVDDLVDQMISDKMLIVDKTIIALLTTYDGITDNAEWGQRCKYMIEKLFMLFRDERILPSMVVGEALKEWFNRSTFERWESEIIKIDNRHNCPRCSSPLEKLELTDAEFKNLHEQVIKKVIRGTDIFRKTSPQELQAFIQFVDKSAPYDVVIDGLNVAYVQFNKTLRKSQLLLQVVQYLVETRGYKCLVLGRHHMLKQWNKLDMQKLMDCADCFFTEDMSEDDPYMLYATLHSGPKAVFVTRDMLRDHKALFDHRTHVCFIKWQRGHQLAFINFKRGRPHFKSCRVEDTITQTTGDTWHIPLDAKDNQFAYQLPTTWLCAKRL